MILCNDSIYPESKEIWREILKCGDSKITKDVLSLRRVTSPSSCLFLNFLIKLKLNDIDTMLLFVANTKYMASYSLDLTSNIQLMIENINIFKDNLNYMGIVAFLLSEILQILSISYVPKFIILLQSLIVDLKFYHPVINGMIIDGLIQILAYPSFAGKEVKNVGKLLNQMEDETHEITPLIPDFAHYNVDILNAYNCCKYLYGNEINLCQISTDYERFFWERNHLILRGFLHSNFHQWKIALENLIEISKSNDNLKSSLVMPLLYKLANHKNSPIINISILQNLTQLGASSEVFSTIKALSHGMIRSMAIDLHLRLFKVEPRTYPFLHKILTEKSNSDESELHLNIIRASAIKEICDLKPHHGSELVSLLSEILNKSLESKESDIPASLAIEAIIILCQNHIINIASTWKAINLTTRYEKRPRVVKSLCNFYALVPKFKRNNSEYEILMKDILSRLFNMIQWSDTHGIECALAAFKSWNYDQLTLDMIPDNYREGIELPEALAGMEVSILDMEVPGECYVQLLTKINPTALNAAGDLISHFIAQEISEYRSGHYLVKEGQPEPINYKNLSKQSIVKAMTNFIIQQATTKKKEKIVSDAILTEALRILSKRYSRPLPPLNWTFLHEMMHREQSIKDQCISLAAKQSIISGTAKRLIENILINIDDVDDIEAALNVLVEICNGVSNNVLKNFMEKTISYENINEKIEMLLRDEKLVTNRENLTMIISIFIKKSKNLSKNVIKLIPANIIPLIALNSTQQKIEFKCEIIKEKPNVENSIAWINELILNEHNNNENREFLIISLINLLIDKKQNFLIRKWLYEFIIMSENKMIEEGNFDFFLDIFCVSIICISGYCQIINVEEIFKHRFRFLPTAIEMLSNNLENIGSVFDFILFIINQPSTTACYRDAFKKSLLASKNHQHFKKIKTWHKTLQAVLFTK